MRATDLVKIDVTAELGGFIADAARTVALPEAPAVAGQLIGCARRAFHAAMVVARPGRPVRSLGRTIAHETRQHGFAVLRELAGHGVGREIHEPPTVANFDDRHERSLLRDGLVLAVEPLISERPAHVLQGPDGWTLRTNNGALAVHYENTIMIRHGMPLVLTVPSRDDTRAA